MYFTTPSRLRGPDEAPVPLHITAVHRRDFTGTGDTTDDLLTFTRDLAAPYGYPVRDDVLRRGHPSYSSMAETMLRTAVAADQVAVTEPDTDPPDLIVAAHTVPEVDPRRCVTTRLNQLSSGDPFGFVVSDQGTAAPFTALALIEEYLRAGGCRRALLVVLEQAEVAYRPPAGTALPGRDTAVALALGIAGPTRVAALRQRTAVPPSEVDSVLAAELAALPPGPERVTVLGRDGTPAGMLCTGPWWALAEALRSPAEGPFRTVLVDHDAGLGYLSLLAVDTVGGHPPAAGPELLQPEPASG